MDFRRLKSQRQQPDFKTASPSMRTAAAKLSQIKEAAARGVRPFADAVPGNDDDGVEGLAISGVASGQQLEGLWQACCAQAAWTGPEEVHVGYGRSIWLPRCALTHARPKGELASAGVCSSTDASTRRSVGQESMAYFTFDELLGRSGLRSGPHGSGMGGALSATDYMALCRQVGCFQEPWMCMERKCLTHEFYLQVEFLLSDVSTALVSAIGAMHELSAGAPQLEVWASKGLQVNMGWENLKMQGRGPSSRH